MKNLLIDTDPGVDDTLAIIYASQKAEIEAITTVCGNVEQFQAVRNANFLKELLDLDAKIYRGSEKPIERKLQKPSGDAVDMIVSKAGPKTDLIALGPLTNISRALEREPGILQKYRSFTVMGGALRTRGNINRVAEYNFWADPEAAANILEAAGNPRIVPLNLCRDSILKLDYLEVLPENFRAICEPYIRHYRQKEDMEGGVMYDPLTVGLAMKTETGVREELDLKVETEGEYTRGMTVPEKREDKKDTNCEVFTGANTEKIQREFQDCLKSTSENLNGELNA